MNVLKVSAIALVIILLLAFLLVQIFFRSAVPKYSGTLAVDGLHEAVDVRTDEYGIPHILAQNEHDLFFAQGFITARERLFQMDLTRRAGRGELSTLFGERTLNNDRFLKTVGFYRKARQEYKQMPERTKSVLHAYTDGINTWISQAGRLPREYVLLKAEPDPWLPEDSIVCGLLMAYSLTRSKKIDLVLHSIGEKAGDAVLGAIMPSYPDFAPRVSMSGEEPKPTPDSHANLVTVFATGGCFGDILSFAMPDIPASNWMIFSGKRTTTGKALFAGSPDLKPTLPALFYIVHLQAGAYDVIGGSMPGTPGVTVLGFNQNIAWSIVNGRGDELDYFIEKPNPDNPDQYLTENGFEDFRVVNETLRFKTKQGMQEEILPVKISRHGPVISDVLPLTPPNTAMMWTGLDLYSGMFEGFYGLNRARNFTQFREALSYLRTMDLNFGYADIDGNIGYQYTASLPLRKKGDGSLPVPGWSGEYEWQGYVPFEELPYDYNPQKGYLASFNNEPKKTPYHLTNYYLFERAIRFDEIIQSLNTVSLDKIRQLQLDTVDVVAKRWVPYVLEACADMSELAPAMLYLQQWNFSVDTESVGATIFNAFYLKLMQNTLADEIGDELWREHLSDSYLFYVPDLLLAKIVKDPGHFLFDDITTANIRETRDEIIRSSMQQAFGMLSDMMGDRPEKWQWRKAHIMYFEHPLGSKLKFLNLKSIPTQGDHHTINSGFWDTKHPFIMDSGGVIRMVVDFSDLEKSTIISPPGQSGHYMSPHYKDLARMWADGGQIPLNFLSPKKLEDVLILKPVQ